MIVCIVRVHLRFIAANKWKQIIQFTHKMALAMRICNE